MIKRSCLILISLLPILMISCSSVEEADYTVTQKEGDFEIREYTPHIVAETAVDASLEEAGNQAFNKLFGYISGKNSSQKEIDMTAPVSQESSSEKIAMTAPVSQQKGDNEWLVSFMMPMSYTMETLPIPNDSSVKLRQVPVQNVAAIKYSGSWSEENYSEHLKELEEWLHKKGLKTTDNPVWARYNPPFTPWFLRRNETLLPIVTQE